MKRALNLFSKRISKPRRRILSESYHNLPESKFSPIFYDILLGVISLISVIISVVSYENSFSRHRTHSNCDSNYNGTYPYVILALTLTALLLLYSRYNFLRKNKIRQKSNLLIFLEFLSLMLFEYPEIKGNFYIEQSSRTTNLNGDPYTNIVCYKVSEILYATSYFKIYFCIKLIFSYLNYKRSQNNNNFGYLQNTENSLASKDALTSFIVINFFVLGVLGEFLRISERPYVDISLQNFDSYMTSVWCLATSSTSIGYGDLFPTTYLGRIVCFSSAAIGALIYGVIVYVFSSYVFINEEEEKLRKIILQTRDSGIIIKEAIILNYYINTYGKYDKKTKKQRQILIKRVENKNKKLYIKDTKINKRWINKHLNARMNRIEEKIDNAGFRIN